jgi:hypothetical protein
MSIHELRPNRAVRLIVEEEMKKNGLEPPLMVSFYNQAAVNKDVIIGTWKVVGEVGASLRSTIALESVLITTLPVGTIVAVLEINGRRARLQAPHAGWLVSS